MYVRVLTFRGVDDVDAVVRHLRDTVRPIVGAQPGYQGLQAGADRAGRLVGVMSRWATEADRAASDAPLAATREEARARFAADLTVETFELRVVEARRPPEVGSAIMVTSVRMDPALVEGNLEHFKRDVAPVISAAPGFRMLRLMIDPKTGAGAVGAAWDDEPAMRAAAETAMARRPDAGARGITFVETSYREVVFVEAR